MFGSSILEVAIGMVFVYLLMSLICSAVNELIEAALKNRATDLERGIRELFNQVGGGGFVEKFYKHPLIHGLFTGPYGREASAVIKALDYLKPTNLPAYIPAGNFSSALIDLVLHPPTTNVIERDDTAHAQPLPPPLPPSASGGAGGGGEAPLQMADVMTAIERLGDTEVGRALRALAEQADGDLDKLRANIEAWFNSSMDRVSGWYKRRTKWIILVLGLILTIFLNVNSITIATSLSNDATLRNVVVAQAEAYSKSPEPLKANFEEDKKEIQSLGLPIGWPHGIKLLPTPFDWWRHLLAPLFGWLLTAAAISMGAPFWFDILNKFMVVRSTVKPHEKSPEESSEDRQTKK
jgi:hypothetical protein